MVQKTAMAQSGLKLMHGCTVTMPTRACFASARKLQRLLGGVHVYLRSSTDRRQPAIGYSRMLDGTANGVRTAVNIHTKSEII